MFTKVLKPMRLYNKISRFIDDNHNDLQFIGGVIIVFGGLAITCYAKPFTAWFINLF